MTESATARNDIDFNPDTFDAFLRDTMPGYAGPLGLERIGGGQSNPTYFVDGAAQRMVLRKRPPGDHARGAHDVGREYRILTALDATPVPVPKPIVYREEPDVVGTPFYLMGCVPGRVFADASLPEVPRDDRRAYYREFARVLAALHAVDVDAVGLGGFRRPERYLVRQVNTWTRVWGGLAETDPDVARVVTWLRANLPEDEESAIVHGDYKINNVIYDREQPQISAVIDWELCTVGDPLLDLAHAWSFMWETRLEEYGGMMGQDLKALGLPDENEFFEDYYAVAQSSRRLTPFHMVLAHFRTSGIFHGIAERAASGNANAGNAAEKGRLDRVYLSRAIAAIERFS